MCNWCISLTAPVTITAGSELFTMSLVILSVDSEGPSALWQSNRGNQVDDRLLYKTVQLVATDRTMKAEAQPNHEDETALHCSTAKPLRQPINPFYPSLQLASRQSLFPYKKLFLFIRIQKVPEPTARSIDGFLVFTVPHFWACMNTVSFASFLIY